ncbi:feruloyl esterase B [Nannizzia gypsea CBS 118893]|uniref:Carboxylic ester hydrolase n=1 Tax=Arthroderma gypseum (strain ATCC MYA-4604 / CBS 118893) TaxID=535722 RepID=E4UTW0_ARTGP|nr:feruloyl esterase B [Nannizzia gypsea CBS 118893]EFR00766.1 feruloyl esterase B [Nannizzia gypsea CBS 118893]
MFKLPLLLSVLPLATVFSSAASVQVRANHDCASIQPPQVPGAEVLSVMGVELTVDVPPFPPSPSKLNTTVDVCSVNVTLTHMGVNDKVVVSVWLPLPDKWNGRFQATGGGGWAAGEFALLMGPAAVEGYSSASTDAGVSVDPASADTWALKEDGTVNYDLLENFASRSIHDMAIVGKAVTESYYKKPANYSYFYGCSNGGRQGMVEAQKYPDDFDGILAGAPAIYWPELLAATEWPQVVMQTKKTFPSQCVFEAFRKAGIAACDKLDGVKDGVVSNLDDCEFNPFALVGKKIDCGGEPTTITLAQAWVAKKIFDGPKTTSKRTSWDVLPVGAYYDALANSTIENGVPKIFPFVIASSWIRSFLKKDVNFDLTTITYADVPKLFKQGVDEFGKIIEIDSDLSALKKSGTKLLTWHGLADQIIHPHISIKYRQEVERRMGDGSKVDEYYRLFLAPGVTHCGTLGLNDGAAPIDTLKVLERWVEKGEAPETMPAVATDANGATTFTRNLCRYPLVPRYKGGDKNSADSFECAKDFGSHH